MAYIIVDDSELEFKKKGKPNYSRYTAAGKWGRRFLKEEVAAQIGHDKRFRDQNLDHLPRFKAPASHLLKPPKMDKGGMPSIGNPKICLKCGMKAEIPDPDFRMPGESSKKKVKRANRRFRGVF
jgi:hypothetical protein